MTNNEIQIEYCFKKKESKKILFPLITIKIWEKLDSIVTSLFVDDLVEFDK